MKVGDVIEVSLSAYEAWAHPGSDELAFSRVVVFTADNPTYCPEIPAVISLDSKGRDVEWWTCYQYMSFLRACKLVGRLTVTIRIVAIAPHFRIERTKEELDTLLAGLKAFNAENPT